MKSSVVSDQRYELSFNKSTIPKTVLFLCDQSFKVQSIDHKDWPEVLITLHLSTNKHIK